jgi:alanyl-tRNA synthetase
VSFPEKEYRVPFFTENGFARKKCDECGSFFWTQDHTANTCGEAPCLEYAFINNPPTKRRYTIRELRESFLSFFEGHDHQRIPPFPVVARWRDDLFVTIASIADFQPFVTGGIIPPPANPLVISQPCLRFNDVDNVGLTAGRHYTIFEMGGAHAFNYPDKQVYWKDQTVRFHHAYVTDVLGVPSDEVAYKESLWAGGGNAGPCLEASVGGLEVSTLVFMKYKIVQGEYVDMPIKIVDTGYGIERFTWLSQGAISGFHAVYGPILYKIGRLAGLTWVDEALLIESTKYSAMMSLDTLSSKMALRRRVAEKIGMDALELERLMTPIENVYAVADHTKTLAFMLAEGVVPSNVKAGYLARLITRRTYRLLRLLGIEDKLADIVEMQIDYWSQDFPNLEVARREILEAIEIEGRKFQSTLDRGVGLIQRMVKDLKRQRKTGLSEAALVELYDSHGIPPEIVVETLAASGMKITVPDNLYGKIAEKHVTQTEPTEDEATTVLEEHAASYPETRALYYEDAYQRRFEAQVLGVIEGKHVILDQTAFYPQGGGQEADAGFLEAEGRQIPVTHVQKVGNVVLHTIQGQPPTKGTHVRGAIDWEKRVSLMRHHTSTHIVLGAVRQVLGEHAWQAGAQKDVDRSRLDVSHWARITPQQLTRIEALANAVVQENLPVDVSWMPRDEAEKRFGFRLYEGGVVPGRRIRVVQIGGWDAEACGGTHLRSTGEIGLIKILQSERIQDGVERLVFASGPHALRFVQELEDRLGKTAEALNTPLDKVVEAAEKTAAEWKERGKEVIRLKEKIAEYEAVDLLKTAEDVAGISFVTHSTDWGDVDYLIHVGDLITRTDENAVVVSYTVDGKVNVVVMAGDDAVRLGAHAGQIAAEMAKVVGGGGGGRATLGQGGGDAVEQAGNAVDVAKEVVKRQVGRG